MADVKFNRARYRVGLGFDFTAATSKWLLVDSAAGALWTPDPDDDFVQTILVAGAVETSGTRQTITNPTVTLDDANNRALWGADDFAYPDVANGETFDTLVLYNEVTTDGDSWLIAAWDVGAQTGDGADITVTISGGYLLAW